jgi:hypothetical protein
MTDAELLLRVLQCQQIVDAMTTPSDGESDTHKYLRWAAEKIAKRIWWDNREQ